MSGSSDRGRSGSTTTAKFLRGLTIGALAGAVVAGSTLLTRRRRPPPRPLTPTRVTTPPAPTEDDTATR